MISVVGRSEVHSRTIINQLWPVLEAAPADLPAREQHHITPNSPQRSPEPTTPPSPTRTPQPLSPSAAWPAGGRHLTELDDLNPRWRRSLAFGRAIEWPPIGQRGNWSAGRVHGPRSRFASSRRRSISKPHCGQRDEVMALPTFGSRHLLHSVGRRRRRDPRPGRRRSQTGTGSDPAWASSTHLRPDRWPFVRSRNGPYARTGPNVPRETTGRGNPRPVRGRGERKLVSASWPVRNGGVHRRVVPSVRRAPPPTSSPHDGLRALPIQSHSRLAAPAGR